MVENIQPGCFDNYPTICKYLNEPIKQGNAKPAQLKDWARYFSFHKEGRKFIIDSVYDKPGPKPQRGGARDGSFSYGKAVMRHMQHCFCVYPEQIIHPISRTQLYCDIMGLFNKTIYTGIYDGNQWLSYLCGHYGIKTKSFRTYLAALNDAVFSVVNPDRRLDVLKKEDAVDYLKTYCFLCEYEEGTSFSVPIYSHINEVAKVEAKVYDEFKMARKYNTSKAGKGIKKYVKEWRKQDIKLINAAILSGVQKIEGFDSALSHGFCEEFGDGYDCSPIIHGYYEAYKIRGVDEIKSDEEADHNIIITAIINKIEAKLDGILSQDELQIAGRMMFEISESEVVDLEIDKQIQMSKDLFG